MFALLKSYIASVVDSNEEQLMSVEHVHQRSNHRPLLNHSVREFRDKHPSPITKIVPISDPDLFSCPPCMQASLLLPNQTIIDISRLRVSSRGFHHALFPNPV